MLDQIVDPPVRQAIIARYKELTDDERAEELADSYNKMRSDIIGHMKESEARGIAIGEARKVAIARDVQPPTTIGSPVDRKRVKSRGDSLQKLLCGNRQGGVVARHHSFHQIGPSLPKVLLRCQPRT